MILTDLGGVVVKIDPVHCHRCWSKLSPLSLTKVAGRVCPDELYEAFERGQVTGQEYLAHVRQELQCTADDETLAGCFNDITWASTETCLMCWRSSGPTGRGWPH